MLNLPIGTDTRIKNILKAGASAEYEQGMTFLYYELIELNVNVYLVEQILHFPLKLFLLEERAGKGIFLSHFVDNAMYMSILSITRLVADDNSPDAFTMNTFQKRLIQLVKPEYQTAYEEHIRDNDFSEPELDSIRKKAKKFRNKRLAHLTKDYYQQVYDKTIKIANIYFPDIKVLCEKLNRSFSNLAFGTDYIMLPREYWEDQHSSHKSDIEEILDSIAKNSHILNLPETSPQRWRIVLPTLTQDDLIRLNQYRKKFGMPEV